MLGDAGPATGSSGLQAEWLRQRDSEHQRYAEIRPPRHRNHLLAKPGGSRGVEVQCFRLFFVAPGDGACVCALLPAVAVLGLPPE